MKTSAGVEIHASAREIATAAVHRRAYQKLYELECLVELVQELEPSAVLEIGTAEGGTFFAWAQAARDDATLVSIDFAPDLAEPCVSEAVLESYVRDTQSAVIIRADSRLETTRDAARDAAPDGYDFLFIDGDHRLETVTRDHELYAPLVRDGGLVAFHDTLKPPVRQLDHQRPTEVDIFWSSLPDTMRTWEFVDYSDPTWGGIGVYRVERADERIIQHDNGDVVICPPTATLITHAPKP